jgi:TRAP-type C4-dicarboxylate transport system substrate-binding protein
MKKKTYGVGLLLGLVVLITGIFTTTACFAGGVILKYSDHDPSSGIRPTFIKNVWLDEIEKQTNGKVKIQDFWGGSLLGAKESLMGVEDGITNIALVFPDFYPNQLPVHQIFRLFPVGPGKWENLSWFYQKAYQEVPELGAELKKYNQKPLFIAAGLPAAFTSTKPITNISDLKGSKWRASSRWALAYLKNAGATPVSVPWADCYMALQTGTIDGVMTNYDGLHMTKLDEAAPNVLVAKELWFATPFPHTVNLDFWNGLSAEIQKQILKASAIAEAKYGQAFDNAFDRIMADEKKAGVKVTVLSPEGLANWERLSGYEDLQKVWVKEAKEKGIANADKIMATIKALHEEAMNREK